MVLLRSSGACERVSLGVLAVADLAEQQPALFDLLVDRPVQICIGPRVKNVDSCGHSAARDGILPPPGHHRGGAALAVVVASARGALDPLDLAAAEIALCLPGLAEDASQGWARAHLPLLVGDPRRGTRASRGALRRHLVARHLPPRAQPRREARHRRRLRVQGGRPDRAALELGRARRGTLFSRCFRDETRARAPVRGFAPNRGDGGLRGKRARARVRQRRRGVGVGGRVQRQAGRASRRRKRRSRRRKVRSPSEGSIRRLPPRAASPAGAETRRGLHLASETTEASITNTFAVSVAAGVEHSVAVDAAGGAWSWGSDAYGQCGRRKRRAGPRRVRRGPRVWRVCSAAAPWWRRRRARATAFVR